MLVVPPELITRSTMICQVRLYLECYRVGDVPVSPKLITRPNTIVSESIFALVCDVDDRAGGVGCAAQIDNSL
jgi:hypothetical protein